MFRERTDVQEASARCTPMGAPMGAMSVGKLAVVWAGAAQVWA